MPNTLKFILPMFFGLLLTACTDSASGPAPQGVAMSSQEASATVDFAARSSRVAARGDEVVPLMAGMKAPAFTRTKADGSDYVFDPENVERPIVLTFYRGGFCPYCNRSLAAMRHAEEELISMGYDVLFVSMDRPEILVSNLTLDDVQYTLLSDADASLTKAFGLAYRVSDETVARYLNSGIDLEGDSGHDHHILPTPGNFIISTEGIIEFAYVNPNYRERIDPELLVTAARLALSDEDM